MFREVNLIPVPSPLASPTCTSLDSSALSTGLRTVHFHLTGTSASTFGKEPRCLCRQRPSGPSASSSFSCQCPCLSSAFLKYIAFSEWPSVFPSVKREERSLPLSCPGSLYEPEGASQPWERQQEGPYFSKLPPRLPRVHPDQNKEPPLGMSPVQVLREI